MLTPVVELATAAPPMIGAPNLDEQQAGAATARAGAQLLLGAAGSGKSTVLVEAVAGRLQRGEPAGSVLGIAATQSAARRWRAAVAARVRCAPPTITTMHSYALQQVQADAAARLRQPPRLLSSGDQLAVVGDVVRGLPGPWPPLFADALQTRHFAERVRDFIGRAELAGWTPDTLADAPRGPQVWPLLAAVWRGYRRVLALAGAIDYAELLMRATDLLSHAADGDLRCIAVDGYHEFDARQIRLLQAMRPPACRLLAAADPDQTIDRFRGAATDAPARFAQDFPDAAPALVLRHSYRFGGRAEEVRVRLAAPLPMAGLPAAAVRLQRQRRVAGPDCSVDVLSFDNAFAEAAGIAAAIRRYAASAVVEGGPPRWSEAAVLVRNAAQADLVEQALIGAGVPVHRAGAGRRMADAPVVGLLTVGLEMAAARAGLPVVEPEHERIVDALVSGMGGADPYQLRRLLLRLRRDEAAAAIRTGRPAAGTAHLLAAALRDPDVLAAIDHRAYPAAASVLGLRRRIEAAAGIIERGGDVSEALWSLWSDQRNGPGSWARGLRAAALGGGAAAAAANRDLDAAMALFAEAGRSQARGGGQQVLDFLAALPGLAMPGDRLAATESAANAVSLLTAHRAKDRQWPMVVVAGVQEGVWPSEAGGLGLLGEELLDDTRTTAVAAREAHVGDERRLFLLACTRAAKHLVITCAAAGERDPAGAQPSRFIADLGLPVRAAVPEGGPRPGHASVVVELRRAAALGSPAVARTALSRLADLAADPEFPLASPATWWGIGGTTQAQLPLTEPGEPVVLTVTGLTELTACPWRWYVTRMLHAGDSAQLASGIGRLVHRVHEAWANQEIERKVQSAEQIVDQVWDVLPFEADWQSSRRRREVMDALLRLLAWQEANADRIAFAERSFEVDIALPGGQTVRLRGKADLGVRHGDGSLAVLDVKTAKSAPTRADVQRHMQLAGYQAAIAHGALADSAAPAGAGLLMASVADGAGSSGPRLLWQEPLDIHDPDSGRWFADALAAAVARVHNEQFPAVESAACRTCPISGLCPAKNPAQEVGACVP